jgi:hypothetical protein
MVASKQIDLGSESVQRLITSAAWLCEETRLVWSCADPDQTGAHRVSGTVRSGFDSRTGPRR